MNNTQKNQQTYTNLEQKNEQPSRNAHLERSTEQQSRNAYSEERNEQHNKNSYSKESNEQQSRNDNNHDNDEDCTNSFQKQGSCDLNMSVPSSEKKRSFKPKLGEPGGADDPNIIGLSRVNVNLYVRFLHGGVSPDEALQKVLAIRERKIKAAELRKSIKPLPNLQTPAKGLLKLPNKSSRLLSDCHAYCRYYGLTGKSRVLFKFLFQEKRMSLDGALKATLEKISKNTDEKSKEMSAEVGGNDFDLLKICLTNNFGGERKKWFLRLVKEDGVAPEEAKKIVIYQKRNNSNWNNMERDCNTTSQLPNDNTNVTPIADCGDLQLRVALLPKDYPQQKLNENALRLLEDAVIEEVARGWEVNLLFKGINYGDGMLLVDCGNTETGQWLIFVTPQLNAWSGIEIVACMVDDLPMPHTLSICLPNSAGQNTTTTLTLLNSQNAGLNTKLWKLLDYRDSNKDQLLMFGIDQGSFETISATGNIIYYGFGSVSVQLK